MTKSAGAQSFKLTKKSCYVGIFVQAIVCNLTAVLFIPLMDIYGFSYIQLGILVGVNFLAQVAVDVLFSGMIDRYGYKKIALPAIFAGFVGLILFAASPLIFKDVFMGLLISTVIFASASGLLEIMVSPITNAIPSENKGASMALMHSFYAWGQVATIVITTLFIFIFGGKYWQIIVLFWAIVPLVNLFMFAKSPFPETQPHGTGSTVKKTILEPFYIIALFAIFFGASAEVSMAQWSSSFMEKGLSLPKIVGDMLGMCGFAVMMGIGRLYYGFNGAKLKMTRVLVLGSIVSAICYLVVAFSPIAGIGVAACAITGLAASLLWPGTLVICTERFPLAGAWMFAILAAAGDIGAGFGPWLMGIVTDNAQNNSITTFFVNLLNVTPEQGAMRFSMIVGFIFPLLAIACHITLSKMLKRQREKETAIPE